MTTRQCPLCHVPMQAVTVRQTQIDVCTACRGIWFDKDELSRVEHHGGVPASFLTAPVHADTRDRIVCERCQASNNRSTRRCHACGAPLSFDCPACAEPLEEVPLGSIQIDRCNACQGVWFDGGELAVLFDEFKARKQAEVERVRREGGSMTGELAAWAALDTLIWQPYLLYHAGRALGHAGRAAGETLADAPGALAGAAAAAGDFIGDVPEIAGSAAGAAGDFIGDVPELAGSAAAAAGDVIGDVPELAGSAAEFAGDVIGDVPEMAGNMAEFAGDFVENVPEMAGALAEAGSSFLEVLFDLLGSLFD